MNKKSCYITLLLSVLSFFTCVSMNISFQEKEIDWEISNTFFGPQEQKHILKLLKEKSELDAAPEIATYFKDNTHLTTKNTTFKTDPYKTLSATCSPLYYIITKLLMFSLGDTLMENGAQPFDELEAGIILGMYIKYNQSLSSKGVNDLLTQHKDLISKKGLSIVGKTMTLLDIASRYENKEASTTMNLILIKSRKNQNN